MTRTDRELLQSALDALEHSEPSHKNLCAEIRARLAEPEDKPVAWSSADGYVYRSYTVAKHSNHGKEPIPLYRHPAKSTGFDQLLERIRFLEQQIAERKSNE